MFELNWFIKKLHKQFFKSKYITDMQNINNDIMVKSTGTKKGNIAYSKWRNKQLEYIEELDEDDNVFNRLKRIKTKNTLFDKLKFHSKSKYGVTNGI